MITQRIDAITLIPEERRRVDPPAPRSVKIELTGRCNYRCSFCALRSRASQPAGDMDFKLFQRIVREMRQAGVEEIGLFFLGESFMAKELLKNAIWDLKDKVKMPYVFLTTNGSLADAHTVDDCMAAGLDSLKWSVNAADAEQFATIMQVKPALWETSLQNLRWAREVRDANKYATRIYASSIKYDGEQGEKMERLLTERVRPYVDEHYWLPLYSMGSVATQREEELGYRPIAGNQGRIGALRDPLPCWAVFTEGHVTSSGMLSACCFDADGRFAMANLNEVSFMEGWQAQKFQALRARHLQKDVTGTVCANCVAYA